MNLRRAADGTGDQKVKVNPERNGKKEYKKKGYAHNAVPVGSR
jgi:hypothetical protein